MQHTEINNILNQKMKFMKKLYSFIMLMALWLTAITASAQSTPDYYYGTYHFSATANVIDAGSSDKWSADCDFTISEPTVASFKASLNNFAGTSASFQVNKFSSADNTMTINGYVEFCNGLYIANENGDAPWNPNYHLVLKFNPTTKEISIDNFSLVDVQLNKKVVFTNVKCTFKGAPEGPKDEVDWSGTWTVPAKNNNRNYGTGEGTYADTFTFTVVADGGKFYVTDFLSKNIEAITYGGFELVTDGKKATIAEGQIVGTLGGGKFQYVMGPYGGDIELEMQADGTIKNKSYGFTIAEGTYGTASSTWVNAYYYGGTDYTKAGEQKEELDFSGEYDVQLTLAWDYSGGLAPTSGKIKLEKLQDGRYRVSSFFGMTPFTMDNDFMYFTPNAAEPTAATINCTPLKYIDNEGGTLNYWVATDGKLDPSSVINFTIGEETVTVGEFCIAKMSFDSKTYAPVGDPQIVAWYSGGTVTGVNEEKVVNVNAAAEIYNVSGMKLSGMKRGINIIRKGGKTFKVNVK